MTEQEWLASDDPHAMLGYLQSPSDNTNPSHIYPPSDRKLRLFACACCRQIWHLLVDDNSRKAVEVAERYADGKAFPFELDATHKVSLRGHYPWQLDEGPDNFRHAAKAAYRVSTPPGSERTMVEELVRGYNAAMGGQLRPQQAALLRDIVGNPYRPVVLPPSPDRCKLCRGKGNVSAGAGAATMDRPARVPCERCHGRGWRTHPWLTPQVLSLAQAAYDERSGRECEKCHGKGRWRRCNGCGGEWAGDIGPTCFVCGHSYLTEKTCPCCHSTGRIEDGTLDPVRLSILADALEEAGCTNEVLLQHLRGWEWSPPEDHMGRDKGVWIRLRGPHVKGCWALDLILGKEVMCNV